MKTSKRYIPVLITLALLSLIVLQIVWLFFVFHYKKQELKDKTQEAVLETTKRLQINEDAKLIIHNMDSLLVEDEIINRNSKEEIRVIVSNIKDKFKVDTLNANKREERELKIISDTSATTTIVKIDSGKKHKVIIRSESNIKGKLKNKAKELELLFLKMAISTENAQKNNASRVDSRQIELILRAELLKRGIDLIPQYSVSFLSKKNRLDSTNYQIAFSAPKYKYTPAMVTMPLFPNDVFGGDFLIKVGYQSTTNFVIKQMIGLLALSLFITILIAFVMIFTFRRLLSQEKLHQIKNDFINNMTHELKTPIATISLAIDAINNPQIKNDNEKFKNYTRILKEENHKLNTHVEQVLQIALLDKGELQLYKKPINLVNIIESSINTFKLQIENQQVKISFTSSESEIVTEADEFHVQTAVCNLMDNALKYSDSNCEIQISLEKITDTIILKIKDNGIGIETNFHEKVFEKFYRVQGGNLHDTKGFGLGLSYVKSIIEAHNGTISLQSEKGKGSEFIITLNHAN